MKTILAVLALSAVIAAPAFGQGKSKQERDRAERAAVNPKGSFQQTRPARSPNPRWDVYRPNGDYAGTDPDPSIRFKLYFDDPTNGDS
jgi:hypothetical protein